jgi:hypothetical protein
MISGAALSAGMLVYLWGRHPDAVYFLSPAHVHTSRWPLLAAVSGQLPSFLHVYAFILLSVAVDPTPAHVRLFCALWGSLEAALEAGQHASIRSYIAAAVPTWFDRIPVLDQTANYFRFGTFDPLDLAAIALGCLAALVTCRLLLGKEVL